MTVTADIARRYLRYAPETGKLFWRERCNHDFPSCTQGVDRARKVWNAQNAGKEAFCRLGKNGYLYGAILDQVFLAHRIIWLIVYGEWPEEVDHINGNRSDNRLTNLRLVDRLENSKNKAMPSTNTSGHIGVYYDKRRGNWYARLGLEYRSLHLGHFAEKQAAINARAEAEVKHKFHNNHGRLPT